MLIDVEVRSLPGVKLRAASDDGEGEAKIEGYAAVFNSPSEDLGGFREVILPGAFDRALKDKHDVRALVDHDPGKILGRTKSGTLALDVDEHGLKASIAPPDTQVARDTRTSIQRGDLDGMSFAFRTITDQWHEEEGESIRELVDLELLDVSVVAYPAYTATQVSARALEHVKRAPAPAVPMSVNEARQRLSEV